MTKVGLKQTTGLSLQKTTMRCSGLAANRCCKASTCSPTQRATDRRKKTRRKGGIAVKMVKMARSRAEQKARRL
jgi:hypothetical protein